MKSLRSSLAWKLGKRIAIDPIRRAGFKAFYRGSLPLSYFDDPNWGDALNPVLVGMLSGLPVKYMPYQHQHRYMAIGSVLRNANGWAEVWGSGFLWDHERINEAPMAVHAVRGPRSRAILLNQGIDCPEVFGDPALLLPRFFNPQVEKKYAVGIIPHYIDKGDQWVERQREDPQVRIIDVKGDTFQFVEEVRSCEMILSSSLHGLICADAYGVPNIWVEFSDKLFGRGFKFFDYFESIERETQKPVRTNESVTLGMATRHCSSNKVNINLDPLIAACPFIATDVRQKLLAAPTLDKSP